jgi:isoleucyl-tRNA synthetase
MQQIRQAIAIGLAQRAENKIKVRQPLSKADIGLTQNISTDLAEIIKDELNVKEVRLKVGDKVSAKLDLKVSHELKLEGIARDLVRLVQSSRKDAKLNVEDRIALSISSSDQDILDSVKMFEKMIASEVLAKDFQISDKEYKFAQVQSLNDSEFRISLEKIS